MAVPKQRVRTVNSKPIRDDRQFVLYWMVASRRVGWNFGLELAAEHAHSLDLPIVVLEALRCDYPWASDRLHRFIIDGMADNERALADTPVTYFPYVEAERGRGKGLLEALCQRAAVVVTDDYPTFFIPRMITAAGRRVDIRLEAVDSNGLLPMAAFDREHKTAYSLRRAIQKSLVEHVADIPLERPWVDIRPYGPLAEEITDRWPIADIEGLRQDEDGLADLPIDHSISPVALRGGTTAARDRMHEFIDERIHDYGERRNNPEEPGSSGLSPYLHFGHISTHEVFVELMRREGWSPEDVVAPADGRRSGWWGISEGAEAYLDQLVTWRELGFNVCHHREDPDSWDALPDWAQATLEQHATDDREHVYSLEEFADSATHDELWNAAQTQLRREGIMHNYLRMLWGKKILEWTPHPTEALSVMLELNNRYAVDGRDPNSSTGIMWVLGRHDRPWGPERQIFGKVRYMSSDSTRRKLRVADYVRRYS